MLRNHAVPYLKQKRIFARTTFQQDGAPPHIKKNVKEFLVRNFTMDRVVCRQFDNTWPPRSPDLNPLDFFFWGYIKSCVYKRKISSLDDLKARITEVIEGTDMRMVARAVDSVNKRLQMIIDLEGEDVQNCL